MKIKLKKKERILAVVFGGFLAMFIIQKAIINPVVSRLNMKNREINAKEAEFAKVLRIRASKGIIEEKFEDFKKFIEISGSEEDNLASAMKKIEDIAQKSNISLQDIKPEKTKDLGFNCKQKMIRIIVIGTQYEFMKFVYNIESCNFAFSLMELDMKVKDAKKVLFDIDLTISFVYFLDSIKDTNEIKVFGFK